MRLVIAYLILVGLPVLGVIGVLRVGGTLRPPLSVAGSWRVEQVGQAKGPCADEAPLDHSEPLVLSISQSGSHLSLSFNNKSKARLEGEIQSTSLNANSQNGSGVSNPSERETANIIGLQASINQQTEPARLHGTLSFSKCPTEPGVTFLATRQLKSASEVR